MQTSSIPLTADVRNGLASAIRATRLVFLVSGIGMAAWAPMVPYAKARLGLDEAGLGMLLLAFGGGSMLSMPLVGWLTHRFGSRRVIGVGGLLLCLALPLLALAPGVATLALALLYFGAALGAVDVAMNAHAVEVERRDGRPLMSGFHGLFSIGGLSGAAGMSLLLALGMPLTAAAVAMAALLAVVLVTQWPRLIEHVDAAGERAAFGMPRGIVLALGLLCFISFLAEGSMLDWSAVFLRDFRGFSVASAGIGYAAFSVAMAIGRLGGDRIVARFGPVLTVRLGACTAAAGFLLASMLAWPPAAPIGFVLVGLGAANIVPVMFGAAGRLPGTSPGIAIATVTALGYAGLLSGPALIGFLAQASSLPVALAAVAGLLLLTAASARLVRS
ncbi:MULTISPECIES: MFS transporter [Rhodanobacter]|uniref:Arabinose efflux permease family protein n=1 Tax=Rhodanobacter denitrificans TaxID=666685 RepID=M4NCU2_9GAMM|nr:MULTISPECIES: MFS transporter [Rhodanobacter]AGG88469.1 arabinose efflux permease family protein [Rhodanobacter denitrificans]UJJ52357.1 MFS transporter [Rhodanobacter denitrificans]UJJ58862.1 MFS transporter [Rhodanobacter denitrificans]UJM87605.1 MFS transporter [Rhodanobacter denitrificans]UJM95110.1 MFS transporter [Rhodanobacter denitrificans]